MKTPLMIRIAVFATALGATGIAVPVGAAGEGHGCPSGFTAKRASTPDEKAKDGNGDGIVCVKRTGDGSEIRDDSH